MKPAVLITGGAGYIGSHTAYLMKKKGYNVIILDSLEHKQTFDYNWATCIKSDFSDEHMLKSICKNYDIKAVMHFAAFIEVGESVKNPLRFYENNVLKTIKFLKIMIEHDVKKFIFSSSCAVYGNPQYLPLTEDHPKSPISPYGKNKYIVEMALQDFAHAYGLEYISLRYFNAAGAKPEYGLGEKHDPETHLIPLILRAAMQHKPFYVFGTDYQTKDGSCIRDYIHVWDLAEAHWLAFEYLNSGNPSDCFNLGTGAGFSVNELVSAVEKICRLKIKILHKNRRKGDPPILIADPTKAYSVLEWQPRHSSIENIIKSAYAFENMRNLGKNGLNKAKKHQNLTDF
ncbi:UDP-glucose 4-epimerase GalE [Candidatus Dependentiae bacterium]